MLEDAVNLESVRRVLLIKLRHHGDVLLCSPLPAALKSAAPHLEIDALVYAETAPMLSGHPALANLFSIDRGWRKLGWRQRAGAEWALVSRLRAREYDLVIHLTEHSRGAWLTRMLGPRYAVASQHHGRPRWWRNSFTHLYALPRGGRPRHRVELDLDALRRIGLHPPTSDRRLVLVPGALADQRAAELLAQNQLIAKRFVHIHAASRWQFKCWPADRVAQLIDQLAALGWPVLLTAAPDPRELELSRRIAALCQSQPIDLAGQTDLKLLAALSARARLFIGVDSAPMHIAAAMGTPTVAIFGPSGENEWGPWQVQHRIVTSLVHPCRPCGNDGCGGSKVSDCLTSLELEPVLHAARSLLEH